MTAMSLDPGREGRLSGITVSKRDWTALAPALSEWVLDAIASMGFRQMTPVQASTIPLFMGNKDVVVEAVTGSGKTLSFLIPTIEKLLRLDEAPKRHHIGAIIISPTRELASQILAVLESLLAFHAPSAAHIERHKDAMDEESHSVDMKPQVPSIAPKIVAQLLLGGTTTPAQDTAAFLSRSPNLIIATPGRLLELLSSPHVHCTQSSFEMLVMDEADRLLDLGFSDTLQKILARLPKQRRTGLFSASMSEALDQLIRVGLRNPVKVAVRVKSISGKLEGKTPASLQMSYIICLPQHRLAFMCKLLSALSPTPQKAVCYLSTCAAVDYFSRILPSLLPPSFSLIALHGKQPPQVRTRNFARFVSSSSPTLLLTTDVAARGLDVPNVDLVLQLDPPSDPKTFVHRCGRTGRAGRRGLAVTFLSEGKEESYIEFLSLRGTPVTPLLQPSVSVTAIEAAAATKGIRDQVKQDRALHDAAQRAFVSWVRSYAKHAAASIFNVRELDWTALAEAWGLLRLPKMPEAKGWSGDRGLGLKMDWDAFGYKDQVREKRRREELEAFRTERTVDDGADADGKHKYRKSEAERRKEKAWSNKKDGQKTREERREKRTVKREKERRSKLTEDQLRQEDELEALVGEVRRRNQEAFANGKTVANDENDEWEGFSD